VTQQDQQVAAAAIVGDGRWLRRLRDELRGLLAPVFCRARSRLAAFGYVDALLAEPGDRRSCWQLAEAAGHVTPRRMQALLAGHAWDWKAALTGLQRFILSHLGDPGAVLVLDETAELKKGQMTVGVARQHAGITGQVENCQTVVFCSYVTARGHAPYDFRLYLPKAWCADKQRRERAKVPEDIGFKTKTELGAVMVTEAISAGVPFGFLAGDEVYGRSSKLRAACEQGGKAYVLAVPTLFDPIQVGKLSLANRVVMAPMTRNRAGTGGVPTSLVAEYYAQRAGAGLVITEGTQPSTIGQGYFDTPGIHSDEQVEGWRAVADAVHTAGGRIFVQLMHAEGAGLARGQKRGQRKRITDAASRAAMAVLRMRRARGVRR
jgi:hypothetical protein